MESHPPVSSTSAVELIKLDIYSPALRTKSGPEEVARKILRTNSSGPEGFISPAHLGAPYIMGGTGWGND